MGLEVWTPFTKMLGHPQRNNHHTDNFFFTDPPQDLFVYKTFNGASLKYCILYDVGLETGMVDNTMPWGQKRSTIEAGTYRVTTDHASLQAIEQCGRRHQLTRVMQKCAHCTKCMVMTQTTRVHVPRGFRLARE